MIEIADYVRTAEATGCSGPEIELSNRSFIYAFLSRAFASEPDEAFYDMLASTHTQAAFSLVEQRCSWAKEVGKALEAMQGASIVSTGGPQGPRQSEILLAQRDSLAGDFTCLFLGPDKLPAPLWESVYVTGRNELFIEATLAVRRIYRENGFSTEQFPHMADDHIAIELAFMASLSQSALSAFWDISQPGPYEAEVVALNASETARKEARFEEITAIQKRFLDDHLNRWILSFAEKMVTQKKTGRFYPSLAAFAAQFCHHHSRSHMSTDLW